MSRTRGDRVAPRVTVLVDALASARESAAAHAVRHPGGQVVRVRHSPDGIQVEGEGQRRGTHPPADPGGQA